MVQNVWCDNYMCDHNICLCNVCTISITEEVIESARSGEPMCETLRVKVLALLDEEKR